MKRELGNLGIMDNQIKDLELKLDKLYRLGGVVASLPAQWVGGSIPA